MSEQQTEGVKPSYDAFSSNYPSPFEIGKRHGAELDINAFSGLSPKPEIDLEWDGVSIPIRKLNGAEIRDLGKLDTGSYTLENIVQDLQTELANIRKAAKSPGRRYITNPQEESNVDFEIYLVQRYLDWDLYGSRPLGPAYAFLIDARECHKRAGSLKGSDPSRYDELMRQCGRRMRMAATLVKKRFDYRVHSLGSKRGT